AAQPAGDSRRRAGGPADALRRLDPVAGQFALVARGRDRPAHDAGIHEIPGRAGPRDDAPADRPPSRAPRRSGESRSGASRSGPRNPDPNCLLTVIRSLLFTLWLYLSMPLFAVGLSPALLMPHGAAMGVIKLWARFVLFGLRWIAGVKVEIRGLEHQPTGPALRSEERRVGRGW